VKVEFRKSFGRDLRKVSDRTIRERVEEIIEQVERAKTLEKVPNVKKLRGYDLYYRIRVGDYRIGIRVDRDTIIIIRLLHRKDMYRYFP
jgi:mRNA-degrading endonuclease RelE of RelBE toxin-antitoxin system